MRKKGDAFGPLKFNVPKFKAEDLSALRDSISLRRVRRTSSKPQSPDLFKQFSRGQPWGAGGPRPASKTETRKMYL